MYLICISQTVNVCLLNLNKNLLLAGISLPKVLVGTIYLFHQSIAGLKFAFEGILERLSAVAKAGFAFMNKADTGKKFSSSAIISL